MRAFADSCAAGSSQISRASPPYDPISFSPPFESPKLDILFTATPASLSSLPLYTSNNSPNISAPIEWDSNSGVYAEDIFMDCPIYSDFETPFCADTWSLGPDENCVAPAWDIPFEWFN
jgi:hypothetical protein